MNFINNLGRRNIILLQDLRATFLVMQNLQISLE